MQPELFDLFETGPNIRNYSPRTRKAYLGLVRLYVNHLEGVTASKHRVLLYLIY